MTMPCPRRAECGVPFSAPEEDRWTDDGTCSFCGSMNNDAFMAALRDGTAKLGATDKNYKVYVDLPETKPDELRVVGGYSNPSMEAVERMRKDPTWTEVRPGHWEQRGPRGPVRHMKFYFQHLTEAQMREFVELHNQKKLRFDGERGFYVYPFFMRRA